MDVGTTFNPTTGVSICVQCCYDIIFLWGNNTVGDIERGSKSKNYIHRGSWWWRASQVANSYHRRVQCHPNGCHRYSSTYLCRWLCGFASSVASKNRLNATNTYFLLRTLMMDLRTCWQLLINIGLLSFNLSNSALHESTSFLAAFQGCGIKEWRLDRVTTCVTNEKAP